MAEVKVVLENSSYQITINPNILVALGSLMGELGFSGKVLVVSDKHVGAHYGKQLLASLQCQGFQAELICVEPGEDTKSFTVAQELFTKAIQMELDRKSPIVALGGGVVGDLTGFVAATYLRGVPFIQVPTSLLAQVDSSVGGKVAINHQLGKNLIGAFYQPRLVLIDTNVLDTLPDRELYTGLAEVIKYGIIADESFFQDVITHRQQILTKDKEILAKFITRCCEIKADVVRQDERESSIRIILNFGHTIAHAIEAYTAYTVYNHGEAVAIGMHGAALISYYLGLCNKDTVQAIKDAITMFNLPLTAPACDVSALYDLLYRDKKTIGGKINWVLLTKIGQATVKNEVPETIVKEVLGEVTSH